MKNGWPEHRSQCPVAVKPFWPVRHELSAVGGVILFGTRLVVPQTLRREALDVVHDGHFGETKSVLRAKSSVYWPGWEDQAKNAVASCNICQENRNKNPKLPLFSTRILDYAFQFVSADLFEFSQVNYLLLVDAYSKWPCMVSLKSTTSSALIAEMSRFFCDFGRPEELESDNGTQFASAEIREFCRQMGVRQVTSSPEFAQANGLVDRHIQTVKQTLLKMFTDGKSLWESLVAIRSTPVSDVLPAPSVLLQGRNLRGNFPFIHSELEPKFIPVSAVRGALSARQAAAAFSHSPLPTARASILHFDQRVLIKGQWIGGAVHLICPEPHSYVVRLLDGRFFRRTRWTINVDKSTGPAVHGGVVHSGVPRVQQPPFSDRLHITTPSSGASVPVLPLSIGRPTSIASTDLPNPRVSPDLPSCPAVGWSVRRLAVSEVLVAGCRLDLLFQDQSLSLPASQLVREVAVPSGAGPLGTTRSGVRFGISMPSSNCVLPS